MLRAEIKGEFFPFEFQFKDKDHERTCDVSSWSVLYAATLNLAGIHTSHSCLKQLCRFRFEKICIERSAIQTAWIFPIKMLSNIPPHLEKRGAIWGQFDCLERLVQSMLQTRSCLWFLALSPADFEFGNESCSWSHSVLAVFFLSFSEEDPLQRSAEHTSINVIFVGTLAKDFSQSARQGVGFYKTFKYSFEYWGNICRCTYFSRLQASL